MHGKDFAEEPGVGSQVHGLYHPALGIDWALVDQVAVYLASTNRSQASLLEFIYLSSGMSTTVVNRRSQIGFGDVNYEFPVFCH